MFKKIAETCPFDINGLDLDDLSNYPEEIPREVFLERPIKVYLSGTEETLDPYVFTVAAFIDESYYDEDAHHEYYGMIGSPEADDFMFRYLPLDTDDGYGNILEKGLYLFNEEVSGSFDARAVQEGTPGETGRVSKIATTYINSPTVYGTDIKLNDIENASVGFVVPGEVVTVENDGTGELIDPDYMGLTFRKVSDDIPFDLTWTSDPDTPLFIRLDNPLTCVLTANDTPYMTLQANVGEGDESVVALMDETTPVPLVLAAFVDTPSFNAGLYVLDAEVSPGMTAAVTTVSSIAPDEIHKIDKKFIDINSPKVIGTASTGEVEDMTDLNDMPIVAVGAESPVLFEFNFDDAAENPFGRYEFVHDPTSEYPKTGYENYPGYGYVKLSNDPNAIDISIDSNLNLVHPIQCVYHSVLNSEDTDFDGYLDAWSTRYSSDPQAVAYAALWAQGIDPSPELLIVPSEMMIVKPGNVAMEFEPGIYAYFDYEPNCSAMISVVYQENLLKINRKFLDIPENSLYDAAFVLEEAGGTSKATGNGFSVTTVYGSYADLYSKYTSGYPIKASATVVIRNKYGNYAVTNMYPLTVSRIGTAPNTVPKSGGNTKGVNSGLYFDIFLSPEIQYYDNILNDLPGYIELLDNDNVNYWSYNEMVQ